MIAPPKTKVDKKKTSGVKIDETAVHDATQQTAEPAITAESLAAEQEGLDF